MDYAFQGHHPPSNLAAMVSQANAAQDEDHWLADSGANVHITPDLDKLIMQEPYNGNEIVAVGNGSGLGIFHIGSNSFPTSNSLLYLNDILHCLDADAKLLSINKFCCDNNCMFELTATSFLIKDNLTERILLQGASKDSLYLIQLQHFTRNKLRALTCHIGVKVSSSIWHNRLGHLSKPILQHIISKHHIPVSSI
jgi:hypothetical protein